MSASVEIPKWVRVEKASQINSPIRRIRFGVGGEDSPRSSIWTAWPTDKGDYYIGVETLTGYAKASFHRDGRCHFKIQKGQWNNLRRQGFLVPKKPKVVGWKRAAIPEQGAIHVASVLFPRDLIQVDAGAPEEGHGDWWSGSIFYFAPAEPGEAVEVGFFFSKTPGQKIESALSGIGKPIVYSDIETNAGLKMTVSVVVRTRQFDSTAIPGRTQIAKSALYDHAAVGRSNLSAILFNAPDERTALQLVQVSGVCIEE